MISRSAILRWTILLLCGLGLGGCRSGGPVIQPSGELTGTERVLVLPFKNMAWLYGEGVNVRSPLTGKVFMTGPTAEGADRLLTEMLVDALRRQTRFQTVPSSEAPAVLDALQSSPEAQRSPLKTLAQTGRMLDADLVFQGYVYRFKNRVGKDYAAESAASVAFDLYLVDSRAQKVVWSAYFDETQQALTDDLLFMGTFFRRGARWITAEEMASEAMTDMFKGFEQP
jgi:curli biogenesis system outer membrane secretion channel CsgG